jgi:pyroglutamyl-peptidase
METARATAGAALGWMERMWKRGLPSHVGPIAIAWTAMTLLVTAFGPFGGRMENASSLALRELKSAFPWIRHRILPVDSVIAPARLLDALRTIQPDALVMLGEAANSSRIRLETTAWNKMDFSIPDIAGRQPKGRAILRGGIPRLPAKLPLEGIRVRLEEMGHDVELSNDPGRYLCNQVFYTALHRLGADVPAGFIHLPLAANYPTARVVDALGAVVEILTPAPSKRAAGSPFPPTVR